MDTIQTLVQSIFQKESLDDCNLEELQSLAHQYPYFSAVQFLLTEKLKSTDEHLYRQQLQKLSLHFSNPLWLDYLLNGYDEQEPAPIGNGMQPINEIVHEQAAEQTTESFIVSGAEVPAPASEETVEGKEDSAYGGGIAEEEKPEAFHESNSEEETNVEMPARASEETTDVVEQSELLAGGKTTEEAMQPFAEVPTSEEVAASAPALTDAVEDISHAPDETGSREQESAEIISAQTFEGPGIQSQHEEEASQLATPIPPLPDLRDEPTETELTFEPYHTVDYFASQGIKFIPEEKPADRFGKQLKSFTEWLKTMKRLPQSEINRTTDASAEQKVQRLADHSITGEEVVTETMAEVWLKQGNKEKAIETYNKLSLLNPAKSAYFASLVEQLKQC